MTTAQRWDYLPPGWSVDVTLSEDMPAIMLVMQCDVVWRNLTRPQRQLLLACVAGFPFVARADVRARLIGRGLVDEQLQPTTAGRLVVQWRLP